MAGTAAAVCYHPVVPGLLVALTLTVAPLLAQELPVADGSAFSLDRTLAAGPAVFVFWNSWLPEAGRFVPLLQEVDRAAAAHGWPGAVVVFQEDGDTWSGKIGAAGVALPRLLDRRGQLLRRFQVTRAPSVLVVGRRGEVLERSGPEPEKVRALLAALAARRP